MEIFAILLLLVSSILLVGSIIVLSKKEKPKKEKHEEKSNRDIQLDKKFDFLDEDATAEKPVYYNTKDFNIQHANRLGDIITESLKLANESNAADTKITRLDLAKEKLQELEKLCLKCTYIEISNLPDIQNNIDQLEMEFLEKKYRLAYENNFSGDLLEKEGKIEDAIGVYEKSVSENVDTPFTYRRLAIIYSKKKLFDDEKRIIQMALKNIPKSNTKHYEWFVGRKLKKYSED